MISIIIQEHNETRPFVHKMIEQVATIPIQKELLFITSASFTDFQKKYGPLPTTYPITVYGNIQSPGSGRTLGAQKASGENLLFLDCHVCFQPNDVLRLIDTLDRHPSDLVGPGLYPIDFPSCIREGAPGYGIAYTWINEPYEWTWLPKLSDTNEFLVPHICACQFMCKKETMNVLRSHGGFLTPEIGVGMEEEIFMRLGRLGHKTWMDPTIEFGHLFKGQGNKPTWDEHSNSGWFFPRIASIYVNIFDPHLYDKFNKMMLNKWGKEYITNLPKVKHQYSWLRNLMMQYKNNIDESWYHRS